MSLLAALQALSAVGPFASRAVLPLFVVACVARFPRLLSWIPLAPDPPIALAPELAWLASDASLIGLAVLALVEIRSERSADLRELLADVGPWLKGLAAALAAFGLLGSSTRDLVEHVADGRLGLALAPAPTTAALAVGALAVGSITVLLARFRRDLVRHVDSADPEGELGLLRFTARLEDAWAAGGMVLALVAPVLALALAAVLLAVAALAHRRLEARAERRRRSCPACGHLSRREASACPACGASLEPLDEPSSRAWPDRWPAAVLRRPLGSPERELELLARSRCPLCAEARDPRELAAGEAHPCGWPGGSDVGAGWPAALDRHLGRRAVRLAIACFALGLMPVVGAVAALVLGRLRVGLPFRRHLAIGGRLGARWLARAATLLLVLLSGVPFASALAAPAIVGIQLAAHRRAFRRRFAS